MISRAEIAALTPKGRTALFIDLSEVIFPTQEACATGLEVTRRTIQNWRTGDGVPLMALYALHSMAEAKLGAEKETAKTAETARADLEGDIRKSAMDMVKGSIDAATGKPTITLDEAMIEVRKAFTVSGPEQSLGAVAPTAAPPILYRN